MKRGMHCVGVPLARSFLFFIAFLCVSTSQAEVIGVEQINPGWGESEPTLTFFWPGQNAKAVVIFIPGGDGHIGLKPGQPGVKGEFNQALRRLSDPERSSGSFDIVLYDDPGSLGDSGYPVARATGSHFRRIERVVTFYKEKTGKPIWLMGHSNGSFSVTEFLKYLQKDNRAGMIKGIILSGSRNEISFNSSLAMPVLFMHHSLDGCLSTQFNNAQKAFERVKGINSSETVFSAISSGSPGGDPCRSGHHMYNGAGREFSTAMEEFLLKHN